MIPIHSFTVRGTISCETEGDGIFLIRELLENAAIHIKDIDVGNMSEPEVKKKCQG